MNGTTTHPIRRAAVTLNGITIVYVAALVNAALACIGAFGVNLDPVQQTALVGLVNAGLVLAVHVSHRLGEAVASGETTSVAASQIVEASREATRKVDAAEKRGRP